MAVDPVCGMDVEESEGAIKTEYQGKTYYFCSKACLLAFSKDPEKYLEKDSPDSLKEIS